MSTLVFCNIQSSNGSRHWVSLVNSEKGNNLATIIMRGQSTTCCQIDWIESLDPTVFFAECRQGRGLYWDAQCLCDINRRKLYKQSSSDSLIDQFRERDGGAILTTAWKTKQTYSVVLSVCTWMAKVGRKAKVHLLQKSTCFRKN